MDAGTKTLTRTLAKLLIAVSSRNSFQLRHARNEARKTLLDYLQARVLPGQSPALDLKVSLR